MSGRRDVASGNAQFEERKEALKGVKCTAMDMSAGYAKIARDYMPQAENCFDHFHVIAAVNNAVNEVRKQEQNMLGATDKKEFFRTRFCFLYGKDNLPERYRERFEKASIFADVFKLQHVHGVKRMVIA
eukprot:TRINITY_DN8476_c0_g3_i5.p2 TRINITY_DN8476_c0_g3~~TRINITY_DN8476_c0_g3_i5.p2  ORF type:complete len:129 (-),score=14.11 TRINITY_DN8476_c0_g3_i5:163-549(-)